MRCEICKEKIEENFLEKPIGTYIKDKNGKKHIICYRCQRRLGSKAEMLKNI